MVKSFHFSIVISTNTWYAVFDHGVEAITICREKDTESNNMLVVIGSIYNIVFFRIQFKSDSI